MLAVAQAMYESFFMITAGSQPFHVLQPMSGR